MCGGREPAPRAAIFDRKTRRPSIESGGRAGDDGQERNRGSKRRPVEGSFARASRSRRLVRDYERLPQALVGLHDPAFVCLMLRQIAAIVGESP